jgi:putative FmdB family regulatory protein
MPIYEYRCGQCGHEFETMQKVSEAPLEVCPACNERALKKKVSAAAFRLKGSGWYETDFKKDKKRNVAGAETGQAADGSSGDSKSSEASSGSSGGGDGGASSTGSADSGGSKPSSGSSGAGDKA